MRPLLLPEESSNPSQCPPMLPTPRRRITRNMTSTSRGEWAHAPSAEMPLRVRLYDGSYEQINESDEEYLELEKDYKLVVRSIIAQIERDFCD